MEIKTYYFSSVLFNYNYNENLPPVGSLADSDNQTPPPPPIFPSELHGTENQLAQYHSPTS